MHSDAPNVGDVAKTDPAMSDVQGNRKPGTGGKETAPVRPSHNHTAIELTLTVLQPSKEEKKNSLRINIELDIDVEIHLTARVKGDITIGLL